MAEQDNLTSEAPASNGHHGAAPSQMDALGLMGNSGPGSPLAPLYEGSEEFAEWAPRGRRTEAMMIAEVDIVTETAALLSDRYPIRGDMMKRVMRQDSLRTLMTATRIPLNKLEFGALVMFAAFLAVLVFLVSAL